MKNKLKCFDQEIKKLRSHMIFDLGARVIEVKRIVGSVDKCEVLDSRFRNIKNRGRHERQRMSRVDQKTKQLTLGYGFMPPIDVYFLNNDYYVRDGHRRVAAAKAQGFEYLDAHVLEYLDQEDKQAVEGATLQRKFETTTRLKENISLHHPYGYKALLREVSAFADGANVHEKSTQWLSEIFSPLVRAIRESPLPSIYPELRAEDIFVVIANFYHDFMGGMPAKSPPETLISGFMFARKIPQKRLYRKLPFRFLVSLFKKL